MIQAQNFHLSGAQPGSPSPAPVDPWVDLAANSIVWQHVPENRDTGLFRQHTEETVAALARLRDAAQPELAADPWQDNDAVRRFAEATEWLLGEPDAARSLDLYPAEATLLVLIPFLYRVQHLRLTASLARDVEPTLLGRVAGASPVRAEFEAFAESHDLLIERGRRQPDAAGLIGWWLFHRWLALRPELSGPAVIGDLLRAVGPSAAALGETLDLHRVNRLLHGLRTGLGVCDAEHLGSLPSDDAVRVHRGGLQRIRDQRLVLLLALAHGMSREITALPQIVVEHVGIPFPVDPAEVRQTLAASRWGGPPDLPVLTAECRHEAVVEGLRAYVAWTDGLLAAVRRTVFERIKQPVPPLPARLSADRVEPAKGVFTGWAAFRFDDRRVRDHFTGTQLYKDPDLAVRELYQNALDACRYRRARAQYLDRTHSASYTYEGRIDVEQGTDEHGREYVECRDNGVGMGEQQLHGVFSEAGSQFIREPGFTLEQAEWERLRPPVAFHPNSRFGIGVLSYFMLADEIRIRTCRMDARGELGPLLEARICGPEHLFRIVQLQERGDEAGTQVRLYLRQRQMRTPWSCVDALERVLGIAEFPTAATDGSRHAQWEAHRLKARKAPAREQFGLNAHGAIMPWQQPPDGLQLIWCEHGGGILVDGLVVQPEVRRGILSAGSSGLTGAVVNLTGAWSPQQLSADRRTLLDDIAEELRGVLEQAAFALATDNGALPSYAWICRVADDSMLLGDLLTAAAVKAGSRMKFAKGTLDVARTGCFLADPKVLPELFGERRSSPYWKPDPWKTPRGHAPDHILLWRLLAHRPTTLLAELEKECPEIARASVLPAMPSDRDLLTAPVLEDEELFWGWSSDSRFITEHLGDMSRTMNRALPDLVRRARELGALPHRKTATFEELMEESGMSSRDAGSIAAEWRDHGIHVPEAYVRLAAAARQDPLLQRDLGQRQGSLGPVDPEEVLPPGHVAKASLVLGIPVSEVCARLAAYGLSVDAAGLPERPGAEVAALLSSRADSLWPWMSRSKKVPPGHVLAVAQALGCAPREVLDRLVGLGFAPPTAWPEDADPDDAALLRNGRSWALSPDQPFPYAYLFDAARRRNWPLWQTADRLRAYGFSVPLRPPRHYDPLDEQLLRRDGSLGWVGVTSADAMPFAAVMVAARTLLQAPSVLVERLTGYGIRVSCPDVPEGLSFASALELLRISEDGDQFLTIDCEIDLHDLIEKAEVMKVPVAQVARWLQELGLSVPDLAETLRAALARVPRPLGGGLGLLGSG
ncbi:ATP-binding protein [Streptomyces klenkii]|uniref:wHTH domain-containing protein n=1 Tax=Streptomyces klenkii TaxID=1420899 RepID=UPI0033E8906F